MKRKTKPPIFTPSVPKDFWDRPDIYRAPGEHFPESFDLYSTGPDKRAEPEDDPANWQG